LRYHKSRKKIELDDAGSRCDETWNFKKLLIGYIPVGTTFMYLHVRYLPSFESESFKPAGPKNNPLGRREAD